jgi:uncharacterized protein (TIGR00730 family)
MSANSSDRGSVCVFCGSSSGTQPEYAEAAVELGKALVRRGYGLVYGGGSVGLMGRVSKAVFESGGDVVGVIPTALEPKEISGESVGEVVVVKDMHERKALMATKSEAFVAMPGGFGTLEELFEVITWHQLGYHDKPVGLLNTGGYFDQLLSFIDHSVEQGFISPNARKILKSAATPAELLDAMEQDIVNGASAGINLEGS